MQIAFGTVLGPLSQVVSSTRPIDVDSHLQPADACKISFHLVVNLRLIWLATPEESNPNYRDGSAKPSAIVSPSWKNAINASIPVHLWKLSSGNSAMMAFHRYRLARRRVPGYTQLNQTGGCLGAILGYERTSEAGADRWRTRALFRASAARPSVRWRFVSSLLPAWKIGRQ